MSPALPVPRPREGWCRRCRRRGRGGLRRRTRGRTPRGRSGRRPRRGWRCSRWSRTCRRCWGWRARGTRPEWKPPPPPQLNVTNVVILLLLCCVWVIQHCCFSSKWLQIKRSGWLLTKYKLYLGPLGNRMEVYKNHSSCCFSVLLHYFTSQAWNNFISISI